MRIRRRFFDDTVDSGGRFGGISIALARAKGGGGGEVSCVLYVGEGGRRVWAREGGECAIVDGVGGGGGLHLWGRVEVTGSGYGVGIDPGVGGCGGGGAKVEYPHDLEKLRVYWDGGMRRG